MALQIYNSLSRKKEPFQPLEPPEVKMYVCGPTVYSFLHVGNFRGPIFFNLVRNWLEDSGFKVNYVYNYTDVDDKIIKRANEEGVESSEISERYIREFEKDFGDLKLSKHSCNPKVSEHIPQIISLIEKIIENGNAYEVEGEVFYSIDSFDTYGKLSGKNLEELEAGHRVEVDQRKKNPYDFSLWKPAKPGEPKWDSPWGEGRPGWHIECSAMSSHILGESIDIHGGGVDLIFPHHENEIAQSEGASKKTFVKYWMHNNFINMDGAKMSKSLGNITTARKFLEKYNPEIFKFMILSAHYRTLSDFGEQQIHQAISGLARVYSSLNLAQTIVAKAGELKETEDPEFTKLLNEHSDKIREALNDDFNTPEVFASIFVVIRAFNASYQLGKKIKGLDLFRAKEILGWVQRWGKLMALYNEEPKPYLRLLDDMLLEQNNIERNAIDTLVLQRRQARDEKDFERADEIRDSLVELGIQVLDTPEGTVWEVQK